jgi:hypothetical protein
MWWRGLIWYAEWCWREWLGRLYQAVLVLMFSNVIAEEELTYFFWYTHNLILDRALCRGCVDEQKRVFVLG